LIDGFKSVTVCSGKLGVGKYNHESSDLLLLQAKFICSVDGEAKHDVHAGAELA
jgi:hypothetical protein